MTDIDQAYQQKLINRRMPLEITITGHQDSNPKEGEGAVAQGVGKGESTGPDAPQMTEEMWRTDPTIQSDLATAYTAFTGQAAPQADALAQWGIEKISNFNLAMGDITDPLGSNGGGGMLAQATQVLNKFTPEQAGAFARLLDAHDQLPTFTLPGFGRFVRNVVADPTSLVGIATLGAGMVGRQAAKEGVKQALRQRIGQAIVNNPLKTAAGEAAVYTGVGDAVTQNVKVAGGTQEAYNPAQTAGATALGAGMGAGMMKGAQMLPGAIKTAVKNATGGTAKPTGGPAAQRGAIGKGSKTLNVVEMLRESPVFKSEKIFDETDTFSEAMNKARSYYEALSSEPIFAPVFRESVSFDETGWKYITDEHFASRASGVKKTRSDDEVRLRVSLLPKAKELINSADFIEEVRNMSDGVKRYSLIGRFDDGDVIRVIVQDMENNGRHFLSVFDLDRVARQLNREPLPFPVHEPKSSVQGKATGSDSLAVDQSVVNPVAVGKSSVKNGAKRGRQ